ncbi:type II secretion system minor pseudopilin GspH [Vibrio sp. ZSDZ34]|uniref:Type II secretion system protein H n=1 Tax=Vibrio gelatinilyticus TaxID=2893468 RepID=A0A9X2AXW4_9VIBR|nr:type II secretion system minor pseudopilin GspH [Vibrio gelatinilyticus]MCJ2378881.1 type II secretion system minor pseudopilin GspH [Vibrio gelatinilyticus]
MPTCNRRFSRTSSAGFTLLEIMLVLVLLSVSAVAVIATFPNHQQDVIKQHSLRLFQRLQLLNEEAVLGGKDFGLYIDETKRTYTLLELKADGWQLIDIDRLPAETSLPVGISLSLTLGGEAWLQDDRLFEPGSLFDEDMFADVEKREKALKPPQVLILASGEITPATVTFEAQDTTENTHSWVVLIQENSQIRVLDEEAFRDEER